MKNPDKALRHSHSVLVVDADPNVLALVTVILEGPRTGEKSQVRVLRARNVHEALDVLARAYVPVDLVLSNLAWTKPDGGNIAMRIHDVRPHVPILYMSAVTEDRTIRIHGLQQSSTMDAPVINDNGLLSAVVAALEPPPLARAMGSW
jgi:CheY-like chemotaxis protein